VNCAKGLETTTWWPAWQTSGGKASRTIRGKWQVRSLDQVIINGCANKRSGSLETSKQASKPALEVFGSD